MAEDPATDDLGNLNRQHADPLAGDCTMLL